MKGIAGALFLAGVVACAGARPPGGSPRETHALEVLAASDLARRFLAEASKLPEITPRTVFCDKERTACFTSAEAAPLSAEAKRGLVTYPVDSSFYYATRYDTPLSYLRALDVLAGAGLTSLEGKRVLDYGYGMIGQLRIFAMLGARVTGIDVDPMLRALYSEPGDQGPFGAAGGSVTLVNANFPKDEPARAKIEGPYDLFIAKNTLKRGYVHPERPVPARRRIDPGVDDALFVRLLFDRVAPGGLLLIYNICPAPAAEGQPYIPWADGRSPFERSLLESTGFVVLAYDRDDTASARAMARALEWDKSEERVDIEHDIFALYTLLRRPS
jgi:hypothetical protein